jgi:hypothetical protein
MTEIQDCFFSKDDGGVSGTQADGNSHAILSFGKDPLQVQQ